MAQIRITNSGVSHILVPTEFIRSQMLKASGDHIKIYLMLLDSAQTGTLFDTSAVADIMETTEKDIIRSLDYWNKAGVINLIKEGRSISSIEFTNKNEITPSQKTNVDKEPENTTHYDDVIPEPDENIQLVTDEMLSEISEDENFSMLRAITQHQFKRSFKNRDIDIDKLILFYYRMGKSVDICNLIIEYCVETKKTSMSSLDKISCECLDNGCNDYESIKFYLYTKKFERSIIEHLGLNCKVLSTTQKDMLKLWSKELHFSDQMILAACDRASGIDEKKKVFGYVNGTLTNWYNDKIKTLEDLQKHESSHKEEAKAKSTASKKKSGSSSNNAFNNFTQSEIDFSEDEALFFANHIK